MYKTICILQKPLKFLLETFEVHTPKCVKNEIRDFEMTTALSVIVH